MRLPKHRPPTHPGEMLLEEFLKPLALSQAEAARRLNMPLNRLNELIKGKRGMTPDTALRLGELFKTPDFWMHLQAGWDLWHALERRKKRGEALRRRIGELENVIGILDRLEPTGLVVEIPQVVVHNPDASSRTTSACPWID